MQNAIAVYTSELAMPSDGTDFAIFLKQRLDLLRGRLENAREGFQALMENVPEPKNELEIIRYFCGDPENERALDEHQPLRELLYHAVVKLLRAYAQLADELPAAGYGQDEIGKIVSEIKLADHARELVRKASGEELDLRPYEADMRDLLDRYVEAEEARIISQFGDKPLLEIIAHSGIMAAVRKKFANMNREAIAESVKIISGPRLMMPKAPIRCCMKKCRHY